MFLKNVWHAFIDPDEPNNDYINSTTIIEGLNFTCGEEYHVVHHQYAGVHWKKNTELYEKHLEGYKRVVPSVFYKKNIFEIFAFIVSDDMDQLVDAFYMPYSKGLSKQELGDLLRKRAQCHGPEIAEMRGKQGVEKIRDGVDVAVAGKGSGEDRGTICKDGDEWLTETTTDKVESKKVKGA